MSAPAAFPDSAAPQTAPYVVAALYQFCPLGDPAGLCQELKALGTRLGLRGTLILAPEGLNGTVAGTRAAIDELHGFLLDAGFTGLEYKESEASEQPFGRFKVRLKKEIVTLGVLVQPREAVGTYLDPDEWNALLERGDVILVDTRNRYEVKAGTFRGAVNPDLDSFRDFPAWADEHLRGAEGKKVAMFCTGGIRCEKSTSLLLQRGFTDVYHLRGGILRYLEQVPEPESRWDGECFVFDGRVTVGHGLREGTAVTCHSCGWPLIEAERQNPLYEEGVSCPHCFHQTTQAQKAAFRDRQRYHDARVTDGQTGG